MAWRKQASTGTVGMQNDLILSELTQAEPMEPVVPDASKNPASRDSFIVGMTGGKSLSGPSGGPSKVTSSSANGKDVTQEPKTVPKIGAQHFELLKLIGQGAFGKVILARNLINEKIYAMKVISKKLLRKKNHVLYMKAERDILTKVEHPFIVR